jgi:tight adherence protein B
MDFTLTPTVVIAVAGTALVLFVAAVGLVVRDLIGAGPNGTGRVASLRRPFNVTDEIPSSSLTGRIDQAFERLVLESGIDTSPTAAFGLLVFLGLAVGGVLFVWRDQPLAAMVGMLIGMVIGLVWFSRARAVRQRQIRETLPDVLDLMSRAVRAGESLDQAVNLIAEETSGPLAREFQLVSRQLDMGMSMSGAMKSLMRRIRMIEVRIMATTLMVHRQTGGNLALTLERMSSVVRDRLNYQRQMKASTGAGRMSAWLIATAAPAMFLFLFFLQYEHLRIMFASPLGQSMLVIAGVLELVGLAWVWGLVREE